MIKNLFKICFIGLALILPVKAEQIQVFEFTDQELKTLKVRKVRGADNKTNYIIGSNENGNYLKANAVNAASGLGKEIKINLSKTPFLNITFPMPFGFPRSIFPSYFPSVISRLV